MPLMIRAGQKVRSVKNAITVGNSFKFSLYYIFTKRKERKIIILESKQLNILNSFEL